jgi:hypothetical protein
MTIRRRFSIVFVSILALAGAATACQPADVVRFAAAKGITLSPEQARAVAEHVTARQALDTPAEVEAYIRQTWAGTGQADRAVRIARCESHLQANPPHNNPHYGVFQMGTHEFAMFRLPGENNIFNARHNINAAHRYWDSGAPGPAGSWRPWACRG